MIRSLLLLIVFASASSAGEFNKVLAIGDVAPEWKNLPGTNGKNHSLADLKDKDVIVVAFTCNSCPYAVAYEDRLVQFAKTYCGESAKVALVAINVNTIKDDSMPEMKKRAEKKKFTFPYLLDESQEIAKMFGATTTPEFFVLDKNRKVVYMGAFDEKTTPQPGETNTEYVSLAVKAAETGTPAKKAETNPRGCKIRLNRAKN